MSYAKWLALLVVPSAVAGCRAPCTRLATQAIDFDRDCAKVSLARGDGQLAAACAGAYGLIKRGLTTGTCSNDVGAK
jgi:hypothetical protein